MKNLILFLAALGSAFGQTAATCSPAKPCITLFTGATATPTQIQCTLSGTQLTCPINTTPPVAAASWPSVYVSIASNGNTLSFNCANLPALPIFAATTTCPGPIVATNAPASTIPVWVGIYLGPSGWPIIHLGVAGMTASQFTCATPSNCLVDTNPGPNSASELAVATLTISPVNNAPVFQSLKPLWSGSPGIVPLYVALFQAITGLQ